MQELLGITQKYMQGMTQLIMWETRISSLDRIKGEMAGRITEDTDSVVDKARRVDTKEKEVLDNKLHKVNAFQKKFTFFEGIYSIQFLILSHQLAF